MVRVTMQKLAAGPDFVLDPGKSYSLPQELAEPLLAGEIPAAVLCTDKKAKPERVIIGQPDPQDVASDLDDDSDEE